MKLLKAGLFVVLVGAASLILPFLAVACQLPNCNPHYPCSYCDDGGVELIKLSQLRTKAVQELTPIQKDVLAAARANNWKSENVLLVKAGTKPEVSAALAKIFFTQKPATLGGNILLAPLDNSVRQGTNGTLTVPCAETTCSSDGLKNLKGAGVNTDVVNGLLTVRV